jgi:hypothetical protein
MDYGSASIEMSTAATQVASSLYSQLDTAFTQTPALPEQLLPEPLLPLRIGRSECAFLLSDIHQVAANSVHYTGFRYATLERG